jgi:cytochrome c-type biogenesis protein CcmH/NrfF
MNRSRTYLGFCLIVAAAMVLLFACQPARSVTLCDREKPNCTYPGGWPAFCHDAKIEADAEQLVRRRCPRCDRQEISDAILGIQITRGPFVCADEIAERALQHVSPKVRR